MPRSLMITKEVAFIQRLIKLSTDERRELLREAIRHKCKYPISIERLDYIVSQVNLGRIYLIKTTSDSTKFMNIVTSEHIEKGDKNFLSQVFPLYGQFTPGFFVKTEQKSFFPIRGTIDAKQDAAAVKIELSYQTCGAVSKTYTLVLYETGQKTA